MAKGEGNLKIEHFTLHCRLTLKLSLSIWNVNVTISCVWFGGLVKFEVERESSKCNLRELGKKGTPFLIQNYFYIITKFTNFVTEEVFKD